MFNLPLGYRCKTYNQMKIFRGWKTLARTISRWVEGSAKTCRTIITWGEILATRKLWGKWILERKFCVWEFVKHQILCLGVLLFPLYIYLNPYLGYIVYFKTKQNYIKLQYSRNRHWTTHRVTRRTSRWDLIEEKMYNEWKIKWLPLSTTMK